MAQMFPSVVDESKIKEPDKKNEFIVYRFLKQYLPENYYVFWGARINNRHPDFIIVSPELGIIVLEVKGWSLNFIQSSNAYEFLLLNGESDNNPLDQAEEYRQYSVEYVLKKENKLLQSEGRYVNKLKFPRACGVVFTNIERAEFLNSNHSNSIDQHLILFKDDFININNSSILIEKLENLFIDHRAFSFNPLSQDDMDLIKQLIYRSSADIYAEKSLNNNNYNINNNRNESILISTKTNSFHKLMFFVYKLIKAYFILVAIVTIVIGILFISYLRENNINLYDIYLEEKNATNNIVSEEVTMVFDVGTNHVGKGTFILIKDGEKYLASKVFTEGSIISFYKDKKIIISESDSNLQEFSVNSDIIELEVGNAYTKIYLDNKEYKFNKKFKYSFIDNVIIE